MSDDEDRPESGPPAPDDSGGAHPLPPPYAGYPGGGPSASRDQPPRPEASPSRYGPPAEDPTQPIQPNQPNQPNQPSQPPVWQPTQPPPPAAGPPGPVDMSFPAEGTWPAGPPAYQPWGVRQSGGPHPAWSAETPAARPEGRARLGFWVWPTIGLMALLLGFGGGALAVGLAGGTSGDGSGGILKVQRRTAAPLPADNGSVAAVAAKLLPSTVQIVAEYDGKAQGATGSGFVFDKQGHIITNNHVVAEAAADNGPIEVIDQQGRHFKATVVGRSPIYDIAVLRADGARRLTPAAVGSAQQMRVGETVVAIGSPLGLSASVTSGIISAVDRPVTVGDNGDSSFIDAVQTDAAINPGNSGGPLVNLQGQVVGMNSAIASLGATTNGEGGSIGVGFAIPVEQVEVTTDQILRTGQAQYPVIGANVSGSNSLDGAHVSSVSRGDPADDAGIQAGDVITRLDGKTITNNIDLIVAIRTHVPGEKVTLTVKRGGDTRTVRVGLDAKVG